MTTWKRVLILLTALIAFLSVAAVVTVYGLTRHYEGEFKKSNLLGPAASAPKDSSRWSHGPLNLLLLGSDSRATPQNGEVSPIGQRSDTIMLVHVSANLESAYVVSIPRDSYVYVPASGEDWGGGLNKINSAFAFGGAPLAAQTITRLTGVKFDGAAIADFGSLPQVVKKIGGVNVCLPYRVNSYFSAKVWPKGCQTLDGNSAEELVRQRYGVPGSDFGRIYLQQLVVKALMQKVSDEEMLSNPLKIDHLVDLAADALTIDENVSLRELALSLRHLSPNAVQYAIVPYTTASLKTSAGEAVKLDDKKSAVLFAAIRNDTMAQWLKANPQPIPTS